MIAAIGIDTPLQLLAGSLIGVGIVLALAALNGLAEDYSLKGRWIAALRSGRYVQGKGSLRREGSYCCLGVLCDLVDPDLWVGKPYDHASYDGYGDSHTTIVTATPPPSVLAAANLSEMMMATLANKNDAGATFAEIAAYIEGNP